MISNFLGWLLAKLPANARVTMWLVVLPVALAAVCWWQYRMLAPAVHATDVQARQVQIHQIQAQIERIEAQGSGSVKLNGVLHSKGMALRKLRRALDAQQLPSMNPVVARWVAPAALVGTGAGLVSGGIGALGLVMVYAAGARARRSRGDLVRTFLHWHGRLPVYLGALLLMLLVCACALTATRGFALYQSVASDAGSRAIKFNAILALLAVSLLWAALVALGRLRRTLDVLEPHPCEVMGQSVSQAQAPGLWNYVRDMSQRTGAQVPRNVVVGVTEGFYVTAHDLRLLPSQQRVSGASIYLPLTYLSLLDRSETDAIVAHELGHFAGEDTTYSRQFSPLYQRLAHSFESLSHLDRSGSLAGAPARAFIEYLLERFDRAVLHWDRLREFAADQTGARVAGAQASARALVRVTSLVPVVRQVLSEVARRPDEATQDLAQILSDAVREKGLEAPDFASGAATAHPDDTHPPTLERLKALGVPMSPALQAQALAPRDDASAQWVRTLFADSAVLQAQLFDAFKAVSREQNHQVREYLSHHASQVGAPVEVHDANTWWWLSGFMALLGVLGMGIAVALKAPVQMHAILASATTVFGAASLWFRKRSRAVAMELRASGICAPGLQRELSWGDVLAYEGSMGLFSLLVVLHLAPDAAPPVLAHSNARRMVYRSGKRQLRVTLCGPKGMRAPALFDLLGQHLSAWRAREELEKM